MDKNSFENIIQQRKYKVALLYLVLLFAVFFFIAKLVTTVSTDRRVPRHYAIEHDRSLRGSIISKDNYTLSYSYKSYRASIRGESIDPKKRELFLNLFSIYSNISKDKLKEKCYDKNGKWIRGNIILSKNIHHKEAAQLKSFAYKLRQLDVFKSIKNRKGIEIVYGLDIIENGESRVFPLKDVLSPMLGYVRKSNENDYIRPKGQKGLEKVYEANITSKENGYIKGKRDVVGAIIHDKHLIQTPRIDGMDIHLNIPLSVQRRAEIACDEMAKELNAKEVMVAIMESSTGKIRAMATSNRYNPSHIQQKDIPFLNPHFTEYLYEAGSVLKPISLSIALEKGLVTPNSWFKTYHGKYKIGRHTITDDHKYDSLSASDIIVHSSNIGISQIALRLTGKEFHDGLVNFGFTKKSGIDLSRELGGSIRPIYLLNSEIYRANSSYGYGMTTTFMQLLKAYSSFNNYGKAVTPQIVDYLKDSYGKKHYLKKESLRIVSKKTAKQLNKILQEVVNKGTGVKAQVKGLIIGGKTGTAHIAEGGRYIRQYHSSFFGFANDDYGNRYTIGALVIRAKAYRKYFASLSAVPTFKKVVKILVELDYLRPNKEIEKED